MVRQLALTSLPRKACSLEPEVVGALDSKTRDPVTVLKKFALQENKQTTTSKPSFLSGNNRVDH